GRIGLPNREFDLRFIVRDWLRRHRRKVCRKRTMRMTIMRMRNGRVKKTREMKRQKNWQRTLTIYRSIAILQEIQQKAKIQKPTETPRDHPLRNLKKHPIQGPSILSFKSLQSTNFNPSSSSKLPSPKA